MTNVSLGNCSIREIAKWRQILWVWKLGASLKALQLVMSNYWCWVPRGAAVTTSYHTFNLDKSTWFTNLKPSALYLAAQPPRHDNVGTLSCLVNKWWHLWNLPSTSTEPTHWTHGHSGGDQTSTSNFDLENHGFPLNDLQMVVSISVSNCWRLFSDECLDARDRVCGQESHGMK